MKTTAYRANRITYAVHLAIFVAMVVVLLNIWGKPGPTEVIAAFIVIPRLHDIGRSGWWYAPLVVGEILVAVLGYNLGGLDGVLIAAGIYMLLVLALLAVLALIPGQPFPNRWGNPPPPGIGWKRPEAT